MKKPNFFSSRAFRKGTLSIVFTAIIIVAVILVNIVATAVSERYPFSVDLTANKDYTIALSDEYTAFVEGIDMEVKMIVCAAEDDFTGSTFASGMAQNLMLTDYYNGTYSDSTLKYARQVSMFLKSFPIMNDKISVTFANPNSVTDFAPISNQYSGDDLTYGDVIISCTHPSTSNETFERYQIVKMTDMFTLEANQEMAYYGYSAYDITGSSLAGDVISALYIVTSDSSVEVAVLGGHDTDSEYAGLLQTFLKKNNYTFTEIDNLLNAEIAEETMFAVITAPQTDYSTGEIEVLEEFLVNDGKYGRTLVYLPSCGQPELPNLEEFLEEWGIEILPAISYDETEGNYYQYPYWVFAEAAESEYTESFDPQSQYFYPMNYRLARTTFENHNGYTTTKILTTGANACGYPIGEDVSETWTVADAEYTGEFDLVVMSTYQHLDSATSVAGESNVLVISGDYFLYDEVLSTTSLYNSTLLLNLFNGLSGQEEGTTVTIEDKVISTTGFSEKIINSYSPLVVLILFVIVLPVALIVTSLIIWIKRKRK